MKLEEAKSFLDYVKKKGVLAENTVNSWSGALNAVSSILDEEERTISFVLENAAVIKNRLQNHSKDISGSTIELYVRRSALALTNFLEWNEDRAAWEKKQASKSKPDSSRPKSTKKEKLQEAQESFQNSTSQTDSTLRQIPIPCSEGGNFNVSLPKNYTMNDLARVVWALAVYAEDFDPADVLNRYGKPPVYPGKTTVAAVLS